MVYNDVKSHAQASVSRGKTTSLLTFVAKNCEPGPLTMLGHCCCWPPEPERPRLPHRPLRHAPQSQKLEEGWWVVTCDGLVSFRFLKCSQMYFPVINMVIAVLGSKVMVLDDVDGEWWFFQHPLTGNGGFFNIPCTCRKSRIISRLMQIPINTFNIPKRTPMVPNKRKNGNCPGVLAEPNKSTAEGRRALHLFPRQADPRSPGAEK